jgi:hypothetical protein
VLTRIADDRLELVGAEVGFGGVGGDSACADWRLATARTASRGPTCT